MYFITFATFCKWFLINWNSLSIKGKALKYPRAHVDYQNLNPLQEFYAWYVYHTDMRVSENDLVSAFNGAIDIHW